MTLKIASQRAESSRPAHVASVCISGSRSRLTRLNEQRGELMVHVAQRLSDRAEWSDLDAVVWPAGFFRLSDWLGPLSSADREALLAKEAGLEGCTSLAASLGQSSPGVVFVLGVDTHQPQPGWRGDQLVVAFNADGVAGSARKIFPSAGEVHNEQGTSYVLFDNDADDLRRFVHLPNGQTAALSVCYDAFAFSELAIGPTAKRANLCYAGDQASGWTWLEANQRDEFLARFEGAVTKARPSVNLIAIHGFKRPGRDLYWQRHGVATASAALRGGLTVGAAHYADRLLGKSGGSDMSALAAFGVAHEHLKQGHHRTAQAHKPVASFTTALPGHPRLKALVRLYEAA